MDYRIGIDAGSKTIKVVVLDEDGAVVHAVYRRHRANIRATLAGVLHDMVWRFGNLRGEVAVTGSAGIALAELLGLPFVQEVVATTRAVGAAYPEADAFIELGGEDAKVVYLTGGLEQRMNATCAGGTGGFIDTIAFMIGVRMSDMSGLALGANRLYPLASRCAVFAQTDVRPLLNAGARKADIAASVLEAVVRQTLSGLACGRPLKGTVVFLGGPLEHIPNLVFRFRRALGLTRETGIKPPGAHLFTAKGAALMAGSVADDGTPPRNASLAQLERQVRDADDPADDLDHLPPLFADAAEREKFMARHGAARMPRTRMFDCEGPLYLGLDAGSTTVKCALVDDDGRLVYSDYRPAEGDVLKTATIMLGDMYRVMPRPYRAVAPTAYVAHATATGYGEDLLRAALGIDSGVVETTAHLRAAVSFRPDATFVLDIGGQDMKALWVRDGMVADAVLNEACSSGCGSFIEGTAHALHVAPTRFSEAALQAKNPVDLGTKCTVFMTSRVRHAQKIGASSADIAAGIAYSVVQNALYRIIGRDKVDSVGNVVVVQGGAFKSDAVLRAFELVAGVEAVRPDTAHLMGAIGAALVARDRAREAGVGRENADGEGTPRVPVRSTLADEEQLAALAPQRTSVRCTGCECACALSVVTFEGSRRYVTGNRCERANAFLDGQQAGGSAGYRRERRPPNVVALERKLLARCGDHTGDARRGAVCIGLMNTLNAYEQLPFWHALLRALGFSVLVPTEKEGEGPYAGEGLETIPSESVCQPAKVTHVRLYDLVHRGADAVFMPRYERGGHCPVASGYAEAVRDSVPLFAEGVLALVSPLLSVVRPEKVAANPADRAELLACLAALSPADAPLEAAELEGALTAGLAAQRVFERTVELATDRALSWAHAESHRHAVVLAGRPYHVDAALSHGIDGVLEGLGFAVVPAIGLERRAREARPHTQAAGVPLWKPAKHLVGLAHLVVADPALELVCLQSFGCGFDALSIDEARTVVESVHRPFTALKVDDIVDTAHLRIRLRTLAEAVEARDRRRAGGGEHEGPQGERLRDGQGDEGRLEVSVVPEAPDALTSAARVAPVASSVSSAPPAFAVHMALPLLGHIERADIQQARSSVNADACFVVAALAGRAIRLVRADPSLERLVVPRVCERCLLDALPRLVERACDRAPEIVWADEWPTHLLPPAPGPVSSSSAPAPSTIRPRIGIVGNALLCFDAYLNDDLAAFLARLGCEVVLPDPAKLLVDDVRYLDQLDAFAAAGVDHVVYLQSFGCLKGHVQARGALHALAQRHPAMPLTVVDYDSEASALNRENRIRLAVSAARQAVEARKERR